MPQTPVTEEQWQVRKTAAEARNAAITAETALLEAEAANIGARLKLAAAQAPPDLAKVADADRLARARGAKELADGSAAVAQSKIDTFKAAVGAIPSSPIEGKVELGDKAGHMESALLATRAMATGATRVATAVAQLAPPPAAILVVPHGETPDLKALNAFRSLVAILAPALMNAQRSLVAAMANKEFAAVAGVGLALDAATKLLGYFRTDYSVGGTESNADHLALAELVAGRLRAALPATRVYLQSLYAGHDPALAADFINNELKPLADIHQDALEKLARAEAPAPAPAPANEAPLPPGAAPDPAGQTAVTTRNARVEAATERLKKLVAVYDVAVDKLMADNTMDTLVRQYALDAKLGNGNAHLLVARLHKAGGSHYVTKNLWNLFGAMPFKVMGGVIVSYSLFDAKSGDLLQSDTLSVSGGFETASDIS